MKRALFLFGILLLNAVLVSGCGKETERQVATPGGNQSRRPIMNSKAHLKGAPSSSTASVKKEADPLPESTETEITSAPDLNCERIEGAVKFPSAKDTCLIAPEDLPQGLYSFSRLDLHVKQSDTQEALVFSRELRRAGILAITDKVNRDEMWGASNEVFVDLNLPMEMWKQKDSLTFKSKLRHEITFDKMKDKVLSKTIEKSSDLGARLYDLLTRNKGEKSLPIGKTYTGSVAHSGTVVFDSGTSHEVQTKGAAVLIDGKAAIRRVGKGSDSVQVFVSYSLEGSNDLSYEIVAAFEFRLIETPVKFKGTSVN